MANKKYPLNITVACSIGLEGGLVRYKDELPFFSRDDFDLVHEWNRHLIKTIKQPEFKEYLGATYRMLLHLSPVNISRIIDRLAVPYRSYYYAKRFIDAAEFVSDRADMFVNVVDFGRGLSPWGHIVQKKNPTIQMYTFDMDETNSVFKAVSNEMNLKVPEFNKMPSEIKFDKDIFVSLGTFVYLTPDEQAKKLKQVSTQFKNLFIELEKSDFVQEDKSLVNNIGAEYYSGLSKTKIKSLLEYKIPVEFREIGGQVQDVRVAQSLKNATEMFLVR